jgi:hypothetical protein
MQVCKQPQVRTYSSVFELELTEFDLLRGVIDNDRLAILEVSGLRMCWVA